MNKRLTREACIKIIEQAERTEAEFADCFTAAVTGDSMHDIYKVRYLADPLNPKSGSESTKIGNYMGGSIIEQNGCELIVRKKFYPDLLDNFLFYY